MIGRTTGIAGLLVVAAVGFIPSALAGPGDCVRVRTTTVGLLEGLIPTVTPTAGGFSFVAPLFVPKGAGMLALAGNVGCSLPSAADFLSCAIGAAGNQVAIVRCLH